MNDQQADHQDADVPEHDTGQLSEGPSRLTDGPEQLGGADAVPDTPDKNFSDDSDSPGRGSSVQDDGRP